MGTSTFCRFAQEQDHPDSHARCPGIRCDCDCHHQEDNETMATIVDCPHCDVQCAGPQGLASHIRSMHPEVARGRNPIELRKPGEAPPEIATPSARPASNGLVWEDPPPRRGAGALADVLVFVPELRRNPGRWAKLRSFTTTQGANALQSKLKQVAPDLELSARSDGKAKTSALYGRYVEADA